MFANMNRLHISNMSSLNFVYDWKAPYMIDECYTQVFSNYDYIRVQYSKPVSIHIKIVLHNETTGTETELIPVLIESDYIAGTETFGISFKASELGNYTFTIYQIYATPKLIAQSRFIIKDFREIDSSILFTYINETNTFDTYFNNAEEEKFPFNFRIEGGFVPSEIQYLVDSENFRDQRYSSTQLSAFPYKVKKLTLGTSLGVPNWVAEKINWILACSEVKINGESYVRSEGSYPELVEVSGIEYPLYVYKIDVEEAENTPLLDFILGSYEWILRNGRWQSGVWISSGYWHK